MTTVDVCQSCGMPMETCEMHGGSLEQNPYCVYCTDPDGQLKSRELVREGMVQFFMESEGKSRTEAERVVDDTMMRMAAWQEP